MAYYQYAPFFSNAIFTIPCDHAAEEDAQTPFSQTAQAAPNSALAYSLSQLDLSPSSASPLSSRAKECGNLDCSCICLCEDPPSTVPTNSPLSSESAASISSTYWNAPSSGVSTIYFSSDDDGEDSDDDDYDEYDDSQSDNWQLEESALASRPSSSVSTIVFSSDDGDYSDDDDEDDNSQPEEDSALASRRSSTVSTIYFSSDDDSDYDDEDDNSEPEEESAPASRPSTPRSPFLSSTTNLSNYSNHSNVQVLRSPLPSHCPPPNSTRVRSLMQNMGLRVQTRSLEEVEDFHAGVEEELPKEVKVYPPLAWRNGGYAMGPRPERARVVGYCVVYEE